MLEQLPDAAQLTPDVREALVRRADGVPLFLEELARGVAEGVAVRDRRACRRRSPRSSRPASTVSVRRSASRRRRPSSGAPSTASCSRRPPGSTGPDLDAELRRLQEHALIEPPPRSDELQFRHAPHPRGVLPLGAPGRPGAGARRRRRDAGRSGGPRLQPEIAAYHLGAAGRATRGGAALEAGLAHGPPERPLPGGGRPRAGGARARRPAARGGAGRHRAQVAQPSRHVPDRGRPERPGSARGVAPRGGAGAPARQPRDPPAQLHGARAVVAGQRRIHRPSTGSCTRRGPKRRLSATTGRSADRHVRGHDADLAGHAHRGTGAAPWLLRRERVPARGQPARPAADALGRADGAGRATQWPRRWPAGSPGTRPKRGGSRTTSCAARPRGRCPRRRRWPP